MSMRDSISLIANTGLQFYHFEAQLSNDIQKQAKFRFVEKYDSLRRRFWLDEVIQVSADDDLWARKSQLVDYNYISRTGKLSDEINLSNLDLFDSTQYYEVGNLNKTINILEKKWIPIPYFYFSKIVHDKFGPTDWVRIYFERVSENKIRFTLLVDTTISSSRDEIVSPFLHENSNENIFTLCENDNLAISYLDANFNCQWVEEYINGFFQKPNEEIEKPFLKHIANYIFFIRILRSVSALPQIQLLRNDSGLIDVDLVVDIGNSKTCAILFENPTGNNFHFNSVKKLEIQDFSLPMNRYDDSFSTRIVFKESGFYTGSSEINQHNKFIWPSPVRIGFEAEEAINNANVELKLSREARTSNSSPKRYLWDSKPSEIDWEYHLEDEGQPQRRVYKKGVTEQLNSDGTFCKDGIFGTEARFSRKSLMTFVYLEIFSHAFRQINSIDFRSLHGNPSFRRKIRRVVISCPTGMIKSEQIALRECAEDAMKIINNLKQYGLANSNDKVKDIYDATVSIIPSVKDISLNLENMEQRKEWIYDEATAAQMVYLYTMIQIKFDENASRFFEVYSNKRYRASTTADLKLRIASLDVGGGTTDLMICEHSLKTSEFNEITPNPLYWESFQLAGDDLLQYIIQHVIIEGQPRNKEEEGCCGVIEQHLRRLNLGNVGALLNGFFGQDSNKIGYRGKLMRTNFINQIALPIAAEYFKFANRSEEKVLTYNDIFASQPPGEDLLHYFHTHFGFRFEELKWRLSDVRIKQLSEEVFSRLFKQIGLIVQKYQCDLFILSGRPFSLKAMTGLIDKFTHLPPNRVVNLNKFWIGRWYPFADNNGFVDDPKTIVTVGSLIALMGGSLMKLGNFRINTTHLKRKLNPETNYIGKIKANTIEEVMLSPDINQSSYTITSLPCLLGYKKINSLKYPGNVLYSLQISESRIADVSRKKGGIDYDKNFDSAEELKFRIRTKMPLKVTFSREYAEDREKLRIEEVTDVEGNDISKLYFELSPQTMQNPSGYWLDTGEFKLSTRS
jgi:hypothetical protein